MSPAAATARVITQEKSTSWCSSGSNWASYFRQMLLCLLVVQNTSAVLLARYTRTKYSYDTDHMLLVAEFMKLIASMALELLRLGPPPIGVILQPLSAGHDEPSSCDGVHHSISSRLLHSLQVHIWDNPIDALKLAIPSGLYYLQNCLVYYSISIIPVPLFQITQQTKLVTTALLSVFILKRSFSRNHWYSIISLCVGSAMCVISSSSNASGSELENTSQSTDSPNNAMSMTLLGLLLIFLSNLSSSVASVYFEVVIKGKGGASDFNKNNDLPSIWMRNIQMAFFTLCIISARLFSKRDKAAPDFFHDFTPLLWLQISIFAFGGLLVASVVKYTDSVQKGLATGLSVVSSSLLSMMIEPNSHRITLIFILGSILSIGGCFFFANPDGIICNCKGFTFKNKLPAFLAVMGAYHVSFSYVILGHHHWSKKQKHIIVQKLPPFWEQSLHMHVITHGPPDKKGCGGCIVLHELADAINHMNITTSRADNCPTDLQYSGLLAAGNKTFVFVYPEINGNTCTGDGNRVHVRWILAPLGKMTGLHQYKKWGEDDLVFNYASSTAVHPLLLPRSNVLQVITNPKAGDQFDLPAEIFNKTDRQGTAWTMRKGKEWHSEIEYYHIVLPEPHTEVKMPEAVDFLRFEYFVSYDPYTFYSFAAGMAGVISIVHPIANVTKQEWAEGTYVGEYLKEKGGYLPGIAYGWSKKEIEHAKQTMWELHEFMLNVRKWGRETTVERFARDCYRYGMGDREFESALLVKDAYHKWYDNFGRINLTLASMEMEAEM